MCKIHKLIRVLLSLHVHVYHRIQSESEFFQETEVDYHRETQHLVMVPWGLGFSDHFGVCWGACFWRHGEVDGFTSMIHIYLLIQAIEDTVKVSSDHRGRRAGVKSTARFMLHRRSTAALADKLIRGNTHAHTFFCIFLVLTATKPLRVLHNRKLSNAESWFLILYTQLKTFPW